MANARFEGKVALVTGGGRGIGAATCEVLARDGASVVVVDMDADVATGVVDRIASSGGTATGAACDVVDRAQAEAAVQTAVDTYGRLDILVCCAGITRDNLLFKMTDDDWFGVINTHLTGTFNFARAAQAVMVPNKYGKMVFLSSTSALGNRGQANYSTAKAGMQGLASTLAIELGRFGINVNAVAPGFVETRMTEATAARMGVEWSAFKEAMVARIPRGILGQPHHIANVIAFLASDDAEYVSGQTIYATGGRSS
jgi:3-oxoacyl-[acyl-carrier protein] reductase